MRLFAGHDGRAMPWAETAAYAFAIGFGVRFVLPKAWFAARRLRPDMNLLMVIAVIGAVGIGEMLDAATVAFLFFASLASTDERRVGEGGVSTVKSRWVPYHLQQ